MIDTLLEQDVVEKTIEKPDDHLAHIINPPENLHIWTPGMRADQIIEIARAYRLYVTALCGWQFIPERDPDIYPACEECIKIAGELMRSNGE